MTIFVVVSAQYWLFLKNCFSLFDEALTQLANNTGKSTIKIFWLRNCTNKYIENLNLGGKKMKSLATLFLMFLLSGCMGTTSRTQTNNEFDEILKIGETSKTSIEELLGRPDHKDVATSDYEYWRYTSSLQKIKSVHHLPGKNIQNIYDLKIWITPQGVLMDFEYVLDNS